MVGLVSEELKTELCKYLGELTYLYENTYDWIEKDKIGKKINAVNELLDINDVKESWFKLVAKGQFCQTHVRCSAFCQTDLKFKND